jgi:Carboxypeptidase regulatory-like domain
LLAVADGYTPSRSEKAADPKAGPVKFTLRPHDLDKRDPALLLKGRVLDEAGKPLAGAVVEPFGFGMGNGAQFGGLKGFDPLAMTNTKGEFRLGVPESDLAVYVYVSAPFKAPHRFQKLSAGPKAHDLMLYSGVSITGRLVKNGKPLTGVAVGAAQKDRNAETFVGAFSAATDADGVFTIPHVPPDDLLVLYGLMDSLRKHGAVAAWEVRTGESRSIVDVGDIAVKTGYKLTGTVVLSDDKPLPAGTRVMLSREEAWDHQDTVVDKYGRFAFAGLPAERYYLSANVPGYHLSSKNASQDVLNGFSLLGTIPADIEGLRLLLEPGPDPERPEFDAKPYAEYDRRRKSPLRGAPALK